MQGILGVESVLFSSSQPMPSLFCVPLFKNSDTVLSQRDWEGRGEVGGYSD